MRPIPLINAEHVNRIACLLDAAGAPADRYLERSRISLRVRDDPTGFLPGRSAWALVGSADRGEALGDFWLDVARTSDWRRARWVRPMVHSTTLRDAIRTMCASYVRQIPMNRLGLSADGPITWFWRRRVADVHDWDGSEPAEQYTLSFMLEVIRAAAGPAWLPDHLELESPPSGWGAATKRLHGIRVEYDQPMLAVGIPTPLLSLPVTITIPPPVGREGEPAAIDFRSSMRQVLQPWLAGCVPSQEVAAELLWTTPRTLRRRLAEEHTTWRDEIHDLIFEKAVRRLEEGRASVREIAEELGYRRPEHFTRFFRHRTGIPPSAYRAEVEQARELARRNQS
jgi:AraC-like DNA-binding protein